MSPLVSACLVQDQSLTFNTDACGQNKTGFPGITLSLNPARVKLRTKSYVCLAWRPLSL